MKKTENKRAGLRRRSYLYGGVVALGGLAGCVGATEARAKNEMRTDDGRAATEVPSNTEADTETDEPTDAEATTITECTTITEPGEYVLGADLEAEPGESCIVILASDVTLNGRGYTISGTGPAEVDDVDAPLEEGTAGVLVRPHADSVDETIPKHGKKRGKKRSTDGRSNVTVRNLSVEGFDTGIAFDGVTAGAITETSVSGNRYGISLLRSAENTLAGNDVFANVGYGIRLEDADRNRLETNIANNNGGTPTTEDSGIFLLESNGNILVDNDVDGNITGIELENSNENTLEDNTASDNIFDGIVLIESQVNTLRGNTANGNTNLFGIILLESHENTLEDNTANGNAQGGLLLVFANENTIVGNTANANGLDGGIILAESDGNTLDDNTANDNVSGVDPMIDEVENATELILAPGFNLIDSSFNEGSANTAQGNEGGPIQIVGGEGNSIEVNGILFTEETAGGETLQANDEQLASSPVLETIVETGEREPVQQAIEEDSDDLLPAGFENQLGWSTN
jgi:parallel beta-helix repeat protein